jgi:hypothetical protein
MRIFNIITALAITFVLASCFKEDEKITPHDPGDVLTDSVRLATDGNYYYQSYYDLGAKSIVATNEKNIWDLGFECTREGTRITLNSSNFMIAANSGLTDFNAPIDTAGYFWKFDASSGNPDSTAFGGWVYFTGPDSVKVYTNEVYVIDRGYDADGNLRGLRKVVFQEVTDSSYTLRFANLDGSNDHYFKVIKNPAVNNICFSFDGEGEQLNLEPPKNDWDLLFTQYTTLLYTSEGDPYPYLLTGVLSNPNRIMVAQDTLYDFASIDLDVAKSLIYSDALDEIGYDWKDVVGDVSSGNVTYVIVEGLNYVVRDTDGYFYKLRFISFYNIENGDKGVPTFEFQLL